MKNNFGKWYRKNITSFDVFYGDGFTEDFNARSIAEDSWNAALTIAEERLVMYGITESKEILEVLYVN